ncbi:MAG: fused response regulator/phosphatase [Clostridiaceae bacterium]|nr:fused response regulator/phosphatase [Clostridiaceae bacterium]
MTHGKILILNKDKEENSDIKKILRKYGYEVITRPIGTNINQAITMIAPHIILMVDEYHEVNDQQILNILQTINIPVIIILKANEEAKKLTYIKMGAKDYIEAPIDEAKLILKVKNQLKIVELQEDLHRTKKALEESIFTINNQKIELEHNLNMASKIQEALIPQSLGSIPNCSFAWHFQPSGKVGGDIFDVFMLDEDHMGVYVIDVMGHGVASSMLAVALSESLILDIDRGSPLKRKLDQYPYYEIVSPLEVIKYLNRRFPFTKYQHYFTIFYMVLNTKTGVGKYVRGAHPSPILIKSDGNILELDGYGTPVGFEFTEEYEENTVYLDSGDNLFIYTDGLLELRDQAGDTLEHDGLMRHIKKEIRYNHHNHYLTTNLKQKISQQKTLKDDLSILEMKWVKFI